MASRRFVLRAGWSGLRFRAAALRVSRGIVATVVFAGLCPAVATSDEVYYVPDVVGQFNALMERADALGFDRGGSPDPSMCKHYQGIARSTGPGTPYFFVTRSGIHTGSCSTASDDPGNLLIVQMGSRGTSGERLRSNRLVRNTETDDSPPHAADTTVAFITFDGTGDWPHYGHPGGVQLVGDVLAISLEAPYNSQLPFTQVLFVDVSQPTAPSFLSYMVPVTGLVNIHDISAGLVALAPRPNGRYLLLVTGGDNDVMHIYESAPTEPDGSTDLKTPGLGWNFLDVWTEDADEADLGNGHDWPTNPFGITPLNAPHQNLNFIREGGPDGQLYLLGSRNKGGGGGGVGLDEDKLDLYRVEWESGEFKLRWVATKEITAKATSSTFHDANEPDDVANLSAAGAFYVSPTGELLFYGTEHDNDGPGATVKAGEWRPRDMVRPGSPTYDPVPVPGGPFSVPEGGAVTLTGHGEQPVTRAWIELYADPGWTDRSVPVVWDDWQLDDYDDFKELDDGDFVSGFSDQASSWRWFAPVGCTIRANEKHIGDSGFPGNQTRTLPGTGTTQSASDLKNVSNNNSDADMDDAITSVEFESDCTAYYQSPIWIDWDLDGDASFETGGESVNFSADGLDGPSDVVVSMQATHSVDGRARSADVTIGVTNVPPSVDSLEARDSLGFLIPQEIPVALVGLPVTVSGTFTDPGIPDHQSGVLDWDDGTVEGDDDFDQFSDAFGGVVGQLEHSHVYTEPAQYTVKLQVVDDDFGLAQAQIMVEVASLADATQTAADDLESLVEQQPSDPPLQQQLENALRALIGPNGAVGQFEDEDLDAAINRVFHTLLKLEQVEDEVDLGTIPDLLVQVCKAAALLQIQEAEAQAVGPAQTDKVAKAKERVAEGDALVSAGEYFDAGRAFFAAYQLVNF